MKLDFGWRKLTRVLRNVARVWRRKLRRRVGKKQRVVNKEVAFDSDYVDKTREAGLNVATRKAAENAANGDVTSCEIRSCNGRQNKEAAGAANDEKDDDKIERNAAKPEIATENAFETAEVQSTEAWKKEDVENKGDNVADEEKETMNDGALSQDRTGGALSSSQEVGTVTIDSQVDLPQEFRDWRNDEGKVVVRAFLEFELSACSTDFVFLRSSQGALYRYPLRRLALADRVWVGDALGGNVANKEDSEETNVDEVLATLGESSEKNIQTETPLDDAILAKTALIENDVETKTLQALGNKEVSEDDKEGLRLDFWGDDEEETTSLSEADESEENEGDAADDLALNFWEDENDAEDEASQVAKSEELSASDEREVGTRQVDEASPKETGTSEIKRRKEGKSGAKRKKEKKRKNANPSNAEYYEPFSKMESEALDGLLYDYFDEYDSIRDEIETERVIDYYDWTYGDARYRDDERE